MSERTNVQLVLTPTELPGLVRMEHALFLNGLLSNFSMSEHTGRAYIHRIKMNCVTCSTGACKCTTPNSIPPAIELFKSQIWTELFRNRCDTEHTEEIAVNIPVSVIEGIISGELKLRFKEVSLFISLLGANEDTCRGIVINPLNNLSQNPAIESASDMFRNVLEDIADFIEGVSPRHKHKTHPRSRAQNLQAKIAKGARRTTGTFSCDSTGIGESHEKLKELMSPPTITKIKDRENRSPHTQEFLNSKQNPHDAALNEITKLQQQLEEKTKQYELLESKFNTAQEMLVGMGSIASSHNEAQENKLSKLEQENAALRAKVEQLEKANTGLKHHLSNIGASSHIHCSHPIIKKINKWLKQEYSDYAKDIEFSSVLSHYSKSYILQLNFIPYKYGDVNMYKIEVVPHVSTPEL